MNRSYMNTAQKTESKHTHTGSLPGMLRGIYGSKIFPYILFFVLIYIVYFKSVLFGLTELDDKSLIFNNLAYLNSPYSVISSFFKSVFNDPADSFYRPFLTISWVIDTIAGGGKLWVYHFSNVFYHFISVCILFSLLKNLNINRNRALVFTAFFAVLPVLNQAVSWIPGRNDSLLAAFIFSSFLFFVKYNNFGKFRYLTLSGILFLGALFTKETAAAAFIVFPAYLFLCGKGNYKNKITISVLMMAACVALWHLMKSSFSGGLDIFTLAGFCKAAAIKLVPATLQYVAKIFLPVNLKVMPQLSLFDSLAGLLIVAVLALLVVRSSGVNRKVIIFACLWFFFFLFPAYFQSNYFMLEHRTYVPLLGIILILNEIRIPSVSKKTGFCVCLVYFVFFIFVSVVNTGKFADKNSFAAAALNETRNNTKINYLYARTFLGTDNAQISDFFMKKDYTDLSMRKKIEENFNGAYHGIYSWQRGDIQTAKKYLIIAAEKNTEIHQVYAVLANIFLSEGKYDMAISNIKKAFKLKSENNEYYRYMKLCFNIRNNKI